MLKKAFSFRSQKPPLRVRQDSITKEGAKNYAEAEKLQKSEKGGSVMCNFRYGAAAMQGFRPHMQDDFVCSPTECVRGQSFGYFAVFDGHGRHGDIVSRYCTEHFLNELLNRKAVKSCKSLTADILVPALKKTCVKFDEQLKEAARTYVNPQASDDEGRINFVFSGTTATMALVLDKHIVVANTGDSRTILCGSGGIRFSTVDHNPGNKVEDQRIVAAGGTLHTTPSKNKVILDTEKYTNLAVSRTLGDYGFKKSTTLPVEEQIVSPVPDVEVIEREFGTDEFLILASDGIFKSMSSSEAVWFVQQRMMLTDDLASICRELIEMAYYSPEVTPDDTTVIIVKFSAAPTVSNTAKYEDQSVTAEALRLIREEVDRIVDGAEEKWVLENEHNIIQRLVGKLPKKYFIQLKTEYIKKLVAEGRKRRFGDEIKDSNKDQSKPQINKNQIKEEPENLPEEASSPEMESKTVVLNFTTNGGCEDTANTVTEENEHKSEETNGDESQSMRSPSILIKSKKGSNASPLLAELGKAMMKRKMSESKLTPTEDSNDKNDTAVTEVGNGITSKANLKPECIERTESNNEVTVTIEIKSTVEKEEKDFKENECDSTHLETKLSQPDTEQDHKSENTTSGNEEQTTASLGLEVTSDKAEGKELDSSIRDSKAVSEGYDLESDIDIGVDYMYDSDEKTTVL